MFVIYMHYTRFIVKRQYITYLYACDCTYVYYEWNVSNLHVLLIYIINP